MKPIRCAIYTRKSSEEGLEQDFNSLAAQREACEAYVKSQVGEGWRAMATAYDDGGYSGGNTERPALKALLADIETGHVDVVVVYKVDRLTRSLADFARIVERFEAKSVSFVSVTQSFNTTSSMGRLTLNVLLSFAQFEREVTGERIRDKIAASKKRGLWMGGLPPLGFLPDGRTLKIEPDEAEVVRGIYASYLKLGCVTAVVRDLAARGVRSKVWVTKAGRSLGGCTIMKGQLRHILSNCIYVGQISHRGAIHPGLHPPIIDREVFDSVQRRLADNAGQRRERTRSGAPLAGLIKSAAGGSLTPTFTGKSGGTRHRYYATAPGATSKLSLPASVLETAIQTTIGRVFGPTRWIDILKQLEGIICEPAALQIYWRDASHDLEALTARLRGDERLSSCDDALVLTVPFRLRRWRGSKRLYDAHGMPPRAAEPDHALIGLIEKARAWRQAIVVDRAPLLDLAKKEGVSGGYVVRALRAAYLAPDLMRAVVAGAVLERLTVNAIMKSDFPLDWDAQRRKFGTCRSI